MKKILIIEDNELNLKLMKDVLEFSGYETETAVDGLTGVDMVKAKKFDLILLDIQMPVYTGYDFLEATKDIERPPVIVVSACAMDKEIEKAKSLGCKDYIPKPIKIDEFLNTIKTYIS